MKTTLIEKDQQIRNMEILKVQWEAKLYKVLYGIVRDNRWKETGH